MGTEIPLRCRCGAVRGVAIDVARSRGNRLVCFCDDCQAYARFLGTSGVIDEHGGTDIFQMTPSQLQITSGQEHLCCVRLSSNGLMRWYTACCRTPVGNTLASARMPFVGVVHCFMDHEADGRSRDEVLGEPIALVHGRFAIGRPPRRAHPTAPTWLIVRSVGLILRAWLGGRHRPSPFFDPQTNRPLVTPTVLTPAERRAALALIHGRDG